MDQLRAHTLLELVKEHKKTCDGMCSLSMFSMAKIYRELVRRELTEEEELIFI